MTSPTVSASGTPATGKRVLLAAPRGYCAGVDRAVIAVEKALEHYGAPVYVRKEIVHNRYVVETLAARGAVGGGDERADGRDRGRTGGGDGRGSHGPSLVRAVASTLLGRALRV